MVKVGDSRIAYMDLVDFGWELEGASTVEVYPIPDFKSSCTENCGVVEVVRKVVKPFVG